MRERLFPRQVILFLGIFAGAAFLIGLFGAILRGDSAGDIILSALEAAILAFAGGLLARSFISLLLWTGRDSPNVSLLIGWAFFLWPGLVDTVARFFGKQYLTRPSILLWIAASVGAFTGMMDGMWQTHNWIGLGLPAYVLDETWGLNGTTQGSLLHLADFIGGDHAVGETRTEAHRYNDGFHLKDDFAFTEGAVFSNLSDPAGSALYEHENTHVWQNRIFGPFYILTYLAWMILLFIPGLIYGLLSSAPIGDAITSLSYYNNPWEAWGFHVGTDLGYLSRTDPSRGPGIWSDDVVAIASIPFYILCAIAAYLLITRTWRKARALPT
jgi:hypothetical protein